DPPDVGVPRSGGGVIGAQAFIGAGYSFYIGLAWDVIHPGAYQGAFAALAAPPALLVPFITLNALIQLDGAGQLAALGMGGGAAAALGAQALAALGPAFGAVITATFNAAAAAFANPAQIWIHQPPPSTVALNNATSNFLKILNDWASQPSMQF